MNSANGEKARDLESKLVYHPTISSIDEKELLRAEADRKSKKMARIQHCIFTFLLLSLLAVGFVAAALKESPQDAASRISAEESRFQQLLDTVDPTALHEVLHKNLKDKYQHGVFEKDKTAMEAFHKQNAKAAERLIEIAKRQATGSGNATVVTTTASTTTVVTSTESVGSTAAPSSAPSATSSDSQTPTATPSSQQSISTPESSAAPTTSPQTTQITSTTQIVSTTQTVSESSPGTTTGSSTPPSSSESSPVSNSPTPTSTASTIKTKSSSGTDSESSTKTSPLSTRTTVYTTTAADGVVSTVTAVTVIPAGQADQTTPGAGATTTTGNASLQTGGVGRVEIGLSAVLGGAVMVVMGAL